jgi:phage tail-like protein
MSTTYYPPSKFYFSVSVLSSGTTTGDSTPVDSSFLEVSGIDAEFGVEEVAEGGENRFSHRLPKQVKYPPLVLKRGVVTKDSALGAWVASTLSSTLSTPILPQNLLVLLLAGNGTPLIAWGFSNAWPLKWTTASLNSSENEVLTESLEFSYNYFLRTTLGSQASLGANVDSLKSNLS